MTASFKKLPGLKSGIGRKFILYILLFSSIITFIGTGLQLYLDFDRDLKSIHTTFKQIESSYLGSIANSLWVTDNELLQIQLEGILRLPDMQFIEIRKDAEVLHAVGVPQPKSIIEQTIPLVYIYEDQEIQLGELYVIASLKGVYDRIFDRVLVILSIQTIKTFLVSLFIFIIFHQLVGKFIIYMASFVESIRYDSIDQPLILDRKLNTKEPDELDQLVTSFNRMQKNLAQDIIRRKIAEKELSVSEHRLSTHLQNTPIGSISWDLNFKVIEWNPAAEAIFGYSKEEAMDKHATELILPEELKKMVNDIYRDLISGKGGTRSTNENITKDGRRIICDWYNTKLKDADGKVIGAASLVNDITEQKQAENDLKKKTHDVGERIKELKCLYAISSLFENQNISIEKIFQSIVNFIPSSWQYPEITCAQIIFNDNQYKTDNFKPTIWKQYSNLLINGKHRGTVDVYYLKEMPPIDEGPFLKEERDLIDEIAERIIRFIERKETMDKSKKLEAQLQQSQKMESIGTLAGGIAHDFNNLLYPIIGYSEMLKEDLPQDSPEYESVQEIFNAGRRGGELVKQILAFSRQTEHKFSPVRFQKILKEVCKLSRATIPSDIEIHQDIQKDCGLVMAEATQLHQIAMNLITNAYHAVEKISGEIAIQLKEIILDNDNLKDSPLQSGQYVMLSVSDNGVGISKEIINNIFEPYFTTKEKGKGTGLGLAVVYGILTEHKGDINVYSEVGKGTTFNVYLPLIKKSDEVISTEKILKKLTGTERILLVDDEESVVRLEKQMLERLGYNVSALTNSLEAFETFNSNPEGYDLVISDMTMPNMTGDQLAQELISIRQDIPIIICTGFSERINREKAESIGIKGFLMKPVVKSEMAHMVRRVLDESKISNK